MPNLKGCLNSLETRTAWSVEGLALGWTIEKLYFDSCQGQVIFVFFKMSKPALGSNDPSNGYTGLCLGVESLGHKTDYLLPLSVKLMNEWIQTSLSHMPS